MLTMSLFENIGKVNLFYLKLFRIFGFIPLSFNHQANDIHYPLLIWSLLQILINFLKLYITYVYFGKIVYTSDELGEIHDVAKLIVLNLTHQTILVDPIFKRQKLRDFFRKLDLLQHIYESDTNEHREENKRRSFKFVLKFCSCVLYIIFSEVEIMRSLSHITQFIYFWIVTISNYVPMIMFNLYSIFLLDIFHLEQIRLNMELRSLTKFVLDTNACSSSGKFDDTIHARIINAQNRHRLIFGMTQDLNEVFGLFWTMNALCNFVLCEYCVYWIYFQLYRSSHESVIGSILNCIYYAHPPLSKNSKIPGIAYNPLPFCLTNQQKQFWYYYRVS